MLIPVRCISCGRPVSGQWEAFKQRINAGEKSGTVLNDLGVKSYCCKSLFLTHMDKLQDVAKFRA